MMGHLILIAYAIATSLALIFLKLGSQNGALVNFVDGRLTFNLGVFGIAGVLLYGTSFALYTFLIAKYDLGFIIPLATALVYILIFVASFIVFKESFTFVKILAIILIMSGIVLLNMTDTTQKATSQSPDTTGVNSEKVS